jgi:hypothetical protein
MAFLMNTLANLSCVSGPSTLVFGDSGEKKDSSAAKSVFAFLTILLTPIPQDFEKKLER